MSGKGAKARRIEKRRANLRDGMTVREKHRYDEALANGYSRSEAWDKAKER